LTGVVPTQWRNDRHARSHRRASRCPSEFREFERGCSGEADSQLEPGIDEACEILTLRLLMDLALDGAPGDGEDSQDARLTSCQIERAANPDRGDPEVCLDVEDVQ
jgi:hypothetical protein